MIVDSEGKMKFVRHNFTPIKNKLLNKNSDAEMHFQSLLTKANLYFVREKGNYKYNTRWCYYDFYLPYYRIYIEIDGYSHNTQEQKEIDKEKHKLVKNKQKFLVRFTNEEVLNMDGITIEDIIDKLSIQLKTRKHPRRDYKSKYFKNLNRNYEQSIRDMKLSSKFEIDENKEIFMYDNFSGNYFRFKNIYEAKMNVQMSINDIYKLLNGFEYKKNANRRYVFSWTLKECESNVRKVY